MPSFLDLPGELRNEIYYAVYNIDRTVHIASDGAIRVPALTHVSRQVRQEALSIFEEIISSPDTVKTTVRDLDFSYLTAFLRARPSFLAPGRGRGHVVLTARFHKPEACMHAMARLDDFARLNVADFQVVQYQANFDWRAFDIGSAQNIIRAMTERSDGDTRSLRGLIDAMVVARQVQVKRTLVERPARQRLQVSQGGMDFRRLRMD